MLRNSDDSTLAMVLKPMVFSYSQLPVGGRDSWLSWLQKLRQYFGLHDSFDIVKVSWMRKFVFLQILIYKDCLSQNDPRILVHLGISWRKCRHSHKVCPVKTSHDFSVLNLLSNYYTKLIRRLSHMNFFSAIRQFAHLLKKESFNGI